MVGKTQEARSRHTLGAGSSHGEAKVSKLLGKDDMTAYLRVALQPTRRAQQAYAAMAAEDTGDYGQLKVRCFRCHQKGHFANKCPTQSVLCCLLYILTYNILY